MPSSPALTIVRHRKPGGGTDGPAVARKLPGRARAVGAADGPPPVTMTSVEIARELRVSPKTIRRMHETGRLPRPVTVGTRSLRWVRTTIIEWLAAGCPDRKTFEAQFRDDRPAILEK